MHFTDRQELNAGMTLPGQYDTNRLVLLPRDPYWLFAYWEITQDKLALLWDGYSHGREPDHLVLRVHSLDKGSYQDMEVTGTAGSWHIPVLWADCTYRAELGGLLPGNAFLALVASNTVRTPRDSISAVIDPHWKMFPFWRQRFFRRLRYGVSSYELNQAENDSQTGGGIS